MLGAFIDHITHAPRQVASLKTAFTIKSEASSNIFTFTTCQRLEIYFFDEADERAFELGSQFGLSFHSNPFETIRHLLYVGAGLRSQIVGEREIKLQLNNALLKSGVNGVFRDCLTEVLKESENLRQKFSLTSAFGYDHLILQALLDFEPRLAEQTATIAVLGTGMLAKQVQMRLHSSIGASVQMVGQRERYPMAREDEDFRIYPLRSWIHDREYDQVSLLVIATDLNRSSRHVLKELISRSFSQQKLTIIDFGSDPLFPDVHQRGKLPHDVISYRSMYDDWFKSLLEKINPSREHLMDKTQHHVSQVAERLAGVFSSPHSVDEVSR